VATDQEDLAALIAHEGPSLAFAGSKFDGTFLKSWLVAPVPIRPAGFLPFRHVVSTPEGDRIDPTRLKPHHKLSLADAESATAYLLTLTRELNQYPGGKPTTDIDPSVHFTKILGCASCHQNLPGSGGLSAPELFTAKQRLNKDWVQALVADPVYWGPMAMPKQNIRSDQRATIAEYLFSSTVTGGVPSSTALVPKGETPHPQGRVQTLYQLFCSQCHGVTGNGKGINAATMFVTPRNHTSAQEMGPLTDDRLYAVIRYGGPAVGKSVLMPSWGAVLKDPDIRLLVSYLRELSGTQSQARVSDRAVAERGE
jgi:mono/diheme cytochrome c family protein